MIQHLKSLFLTLVWLGAAALQAQSLANGTYTIYSAVNGGNTGRKALVLACTGDMPGLTIDLQPFDRNDPAKLWNLTRLRDGSFTITNAKL